jgi:hypothetical protein
MCVHTLLIYDNKSLASHKECDFVQHVFYVGATVLYVGASLNFRFSDLLPLPHLLVVFTSVSLSFICIYFRFLIFELYRFIFYLYRFIF